MKKEVWQLPENRDLIDWQLPPMRCYKISVPDHPDAITAFFDSWHQLTKWSSWQRDNDKFGAVVAAAFRLGAPSPCEESEDMSDIADAIRYLADTLELNVWQQQTQTCSGGGGGGSCLPDPLAPLPTQLEGDDSHQIFPTIPNESPDGVSQEDNYLCAVSAYLVDSWEATQIALNEQWQVVGGTAATIIAFLQEKFPGGMIVPFIASIISQLLVIGEIAYLASVLDRAADSATQQKEQLREAVRGASSPLDAKRRWESVIADNRASRGRVVAGLLHLQSQLLDWDKIMGGDVNVPAEYYLECDETGTAPFGWEYVKAVPVQVLPFAGSGVSAMVAALPSDPASLTFSASSAGRTARLDIVFEPRPALGPGEEWVGFRHTPLFVGNVWNAGLSSPTDLGTSFSGFTTVNGINQSVPVNVYLSGTFHPVTPAGEVGYQSGGLNFAADLVRTGYTCQSVAAGQCSVAWSEFYWVKRLAL